MRHTTPCFPSRRPHCHRFADPGAVRSVKEKRIRPRRHARLRTIFESGWISFYLNVDPFFQSHALTGHRIPAQGANPGNPPGKRNPRSEGTPHSRIAAHLGSRTSTPPAAFRLSGRPRAPQTHSATAESTADGSTATGVTGANSEHHPLISKSLNIFPSVRRNNPLRLALSTSCNELMAACL